MAVTLGCRLKTAFYLVEIGRFDPFFCKGNVDIAMDLHDQTNFSCKIEYAIESRILKTCHSTGYFS